MRLHEYYYFGKTYICYLDIYFYGGGNLFGIDIETLSHKENAVVLSCALTYFTTTEQYTFESLIEKTCFVKFDAKEQIQKYKRGISKSTVDWWKKQSKEAKEFSLTPSSQDVSLSVGAEKLRSYVKEHSKGKELVFCRGSLDQFVMCDLFEQLELPQLFNYYQYRDFRTAIECLKDNAERGYCELPGLTGVIQHNPIHDNCRDILMLLS